MSQTGFYKFLHTRYLDDFINGKKIRISRLEYFQLLEAVTGNKWIGDTDEGTSINTVNIKTSVSPNNGQDDIRELLENERLIKFGDNCSVSNLEISNCIIEKRIDCFIFSLSHGSLNDLKQKMCFSDKPENNYDCCIEILNIEKFILRIAETGKTTDGKKIGNLFKKIYWDDVVYENNRGDIIYNENVLIDKRKTPSAFRKNSIFDGQQEYRLVFDIKAPINQDYLYITIDAPSDIFEVKFKNCGKVHKPDTSPTKESEELLVTLKKAHNQSSLKYKNIISQYDDWWEPLPTNASKEIISKKRKERRQKIEENNEQERNALINEFIPDFIKDDFRKIAKTYWALREKDRQKYRCKNVDKTLINCADNSKMRSNIATIYLRTFFTDLDNYLGKF